MSRPGPSLGEFEQFYAEEFAFVWRVLRRFGVAPEQLEDAAQDVFVVWVRRHDELGQHASARTCLYGIARRVAADCRRAAARAARRHAALAAVAVERDDSFEREVERQHAMTAVDRALRHLSVVQREAYLLSEVEGLSAQQIGTALRISPNTASSRLRLARQRLAAALGEAHPRPAREEPPTEVRQRAWALLVPAWQQWLAAPSASSVVGLAARFAPHLLVGTLYATILGLALTPPAGDPPAPLQRRDPPVVVAAARSSVPVLDDMSEATAATAPRPVGAPAPRDPARRSSPRAPAVPADPLGREARQIAAAQRLLADGRADEALVLLATHADEAPHGRLADEREALRAAARCRRGERDAGLAAAAQWFAGRLDAPALASARALCRRENYPPTSDEAAPDGHSP